MEGEADHKAELVDLAKEGTSFLPFWPLALCTAVLIKEKWFDLMFSVKGSWFDITLPLVFPKTSQTIIVKPSYC